MVVGRGDSVMDAFFPRRAFEVPEIDRGALLIWNESQWWERYRKIFHTSNRYIETHVAIYSIMLTVAIASRESLFLIILFLVFLVPMVLYLYKKKNDMRNPSRKGLVVPGVYERGVQLTPSGEFVTFWEMDHIKRSTLGFNNWLVIRSRFGPRTWRIAMAFLGADGFLEVYKRLAERDSPPRAPRLIVYGSGSR